MTQWLTAISVVMIILISALLWATVLAYIAVTKKHQSKPIVVQSALPLLIQRVPISMSVM
jgi:hypothetical protein